MSSNPLSAYACPSLPRDAFARAALEGLGRAQKFIPSAWLYDQRGSELFEEITRLDEYYQTRTEIGILQACAPLLAEAVAPGTVIIELGSGSSRKTPLLLRALREPHAYVPVDIAEDFLRASASALAANFPKLTVLPVVADFTQPFHLPPQVSDTPHPRLGFFPGSTIGNFTPAEAVRFLQHAARLLGRNRRMVVGVDATKDAAILVPAYNDSRGITAEFNLNLLRRINLELGADFDVSAFRHEARYHDKLGRIEMHLVSQRKQTVNLLGHRFSFEPEETIHTENSYKYSVPEFQALAASAGWHPQAVWQDPARRFSVHLLSNIVSEIA